MLGTWQGQTIPRVSLDHPASRDVLTPEQIRRIGARDLNDLVQTFPAMSTRPYNGGEAAAPSFSTRGLPDDGLTEYVDVLIDGTPAAALPYGWTAFSFLPLSPERVYAVDLIRGGHTVRYSPNTVGGVLNFLTEPVPTQGAVLRFQQWIGSNDFRASTMSYGASDGDGGGFRATFTDRSGDGIRRGAPFDQKDLHLRFDQRLDERTRVSTSVSWFENDHDAPGGLTRAAFDADRWANGRPANRFRGSRGAIDSVVHRDFGEESWGELSLALSGTTRHLRAQRPHFGAPATLSDWKDESYWATVAARAERRFGWAGARHQLHGGLKLHREWLPSYRITSEAWPGGGARTVSQDWGFRSTVVAAHIDDTIRFNDSVQAVIGVRAEAVPQTGGFDSVSGMHYDDDFSALLPAASLSWKTSESTAVFANYNESFRAPQVWGYAYTTSPSEELKFERGRALEFGGRVQNFHGLHASAALWRAEFDDFGVFYSGFYENLGAIKATGVDFVVEWEPGVWNDALEGWGVWGSWTLQDSELQEGPNAGNETPYAWENKASWRLWWQPLRQTEWSLGGVYVGPSFSDDANTKTESADGTLGENDGWTIWDTRIAHEVFVTEAAGVTLACGATNLFDTEWEVHSRGGFFGGGLVAGAPRQVYVMVEFQLDW